MPHIYTFQPRTFAAKYAADQNERDVMNGNIMTSEYGPEDKWAVLEDGNPVMLFKTREEAEKWLNRWVAE